MNVPPPSSSQPNALPSVRLDQPQQAQLHQVVGVAPSDKATHVANDLLKSMPSSNEPLDISEEKYIDALTKALDEPELDHLLNEILDGRPPASEREEKQAEKILQEYFGEIPETTKEHKPVAKDEELDDILNDTSSLRKLEEEDESLEEKTPTETDETVDELEKFYQELGPTFDGKEPGVKDTPVKHSWEEKGKEKVDKTSESTTASNSRSRSSSDLSSSSRSRAPSLIGEKIEKISREWGIIPKSSSSSSTQSAGSASTSSSSATDRSIALTIYRYVLKHLPRGIARYFSRLVVKDGRISISDISNKMIPRLSPRLMKDLSPDQLRNLTSKQFDQMSQAQFAAIGPKINDLGPDNLAYIISNRLDEDRRTVFLTMIAEEWGDGNITDKKLEKLFSKLEPEDIVDFFGYLDKHDDYTEILSGIFPLAFRDEMLDVDLISKLPPSLISDLSTEELQSLTPEHFDQMSESQLFAIGPRKLEDIGAKNMAYIIDNRLDETAANNFLIDISQRCVQGYLDDALVAKLFTELGFEKTSDFLSELYEKNHDLFTEIYPKVFDKTVIHADESYIAELLVNPENKKAADSVIVRNSSGQSESLTPSVIMMKDAHRNRYIINGKDIDPAKKLPMRKEAVYESLYEAAGKNDKLTKQLELFLTQDTISGTTGAFLKKFSANMTVNPNVSQTYYVLDVFLPDPKNSKDQGFVRALVINDLTLMDVKASTEDPSTPPIGYAQVKTTISIPLDDLLAGKTDRASVDFNLSPVFDTPPDQLKEPAKYLKKGEDTFDIALVDYEYKEVQFEDDSQTSSDLSYLSFAAKQGKLKDQLETNYEDSVAVEYVSQRLGANKKDRALKMTDITSSLKKDEASSLEGLRELFKDDDFGLALISEIEEFSKLPKNADKDLMTIANQFKKDVTDVNLKLKVPREAYGVADSKWLASFAAKDAEIIKEMVLKEIKPFEREKITPEIKEQILNQISANIDKMEKKASKQIADLESSLEESGAEIDEFKEELVEILKKASEAPKTKGKYRVTYDRETYDKEIGKLKERFGLGDLATEDSDLVTDIFELCLEDISQSLSGLLEQARGRDVRIKAQIEERFNRSKMAFYENEVYFPERGKIYAEILLDKFLDTREFFS